MFAEKLGALFGKKVPTSSQDPRVSSAGKIVPADGSPLPHISRKALSRVKDILPIPEACRYCGPEFPVVLIENSQIYKRNYGEWPYLYHCKNCDSYVGLHPHTDLPLGTLANRELRDARKTGKTQFIRFMEIGDYNRSESYEWLADKLGIPVNECHWSWFEVETCKRAEEVCRESADEMEANATKLKALRRSKRY